MKLIWRQHIIRTITVILLILVLVTPVSSQDSEFYYTWTHHKTDEYYFTIMLSAERCNEGFSPEFLVDNPFINPPSAKDNEVVTPYKATIMQLTVLASITYPNGSSCNKKMDVIIMLLVSTWERSFLSMADSTYGSCEPAVQYNYLESHELLQIQIIPLDYTEEIVYQVSVALSWSFQWKVEEMPEELIDPRPAILLLVFAAAVGCAALILSWNPHKT
jgi:hypothetical protein